MAKKNWISVIQNEDKDDVNTEQIAWESSSSEDESSLFLPSEVRKISDVSRLPQIIPFSSCYDYNITFKLNAESESPVIKSSGVNRISPVLWQKTSQINDKSLSPIIKKRRLRMKKKTEPLFKECDKSPELFCAGSTQNIENESPDFHTLNSQATMKIEPFLSQFGSSVEEDVKEANTFLYYNPPKRKRTCKKGGVAHQLQTVLKLKKSRIKIWHHEKLKNVDNPLDNYEHVINFKFIDSWIEYGVILVKCAIVYKTSVSEEMKQPNIFILNLGVSQILKIEFAEGGIYQLYPPYSVDNVTYNEQNVPYFYNVSKII